MRGLANRAKSGDIKSFKSAPQHSPTKRVDETLAARKPVLRYEP